MLPLFATEFGFVGFYRVLVPLVTAEFSSCIGSYRVWFHGFLQSLVSWVPVVTCFIISYRVFVSIEYS